MRAASIGLLWALTVALAQAVAPVPAAARPPAASADADEEEFAPDESVGQGGPLEVGTVDPIVGDGRTLVAVPITGGPAALVKERPDFPAHPWLTCAGAATLPGRARQSPLVITPAVRAPTSLACLAHLRHAEVPVTIPLLPPPPGLYAELSVAQPFARDPAITVRPFLIEASGARQPQRLHAAASGAQVKVNADGTATLELGGDKAPRAVVLVMSDGENHGVAFIPVVARTALPVKAARKAMVEVRVAGRSFGPLKAKRGRVTVPVEVPVGTTTGVVRARGRAGNVKEQLVDLHTPMRSRVVGLLPSESVGAGEEAVLVVAAAADDGRPAPESTPPIGEAARGEVTAVTRVAAGLWTATYRAPQEPGEDEIMIRLKDDPAAGEDAVRATISIGAPASIEVEAPKGPFSPGSTVTLTTKVSDKAGNPVTAAPLALTPPGGERVEVPPGGAVEVRLPELLPEDGTARVVLESGAAREEVELAMVPGPPASGTLAVVPSAREADLHIEVRDAFGNSTDLKDFDLVIDGGRTEGLRANGKGFAATLVADDEARLAQIELRAEQTILDRAIIEFSPPTSAWMVGGYAVGGFAYNLGAIAAPRFALGLDLRAGFGPIQISAGLRGSYLYQGSQIQQTIAGAERTIDWTLHVVGFSLPVRLRYPISEDWGISVAGEPVLTYVSTTVSADFTTTSQSEEAVAFGGAGEITGDYLLGPGRILLTVRYGSTVVSDGLLDGELDGLSVLVGYAWFFWDVGG